MIDLSSRRSINDWIIARSDAREVAVVVAARSILRALPMIIDDFQGSSVNRSRLFETFRNASIVWTIARYPALRERLRSTAASVRMSRFSPLHSAMTFALSAAEDAGGKAVFAAAAAASDAASGAVEVLRFSISTGGTNRNGSPRPKFSQALADFDSALLSDVDLLDRGVSPEDVAASPVWPSGMPQVFLSVYQDVRLRFPRQNDWTVWIDWYQNRLFGGETDQVIERRRVDAAAQFPRRSIDYVNTLIADLFEGNQPEKGWIKKLAALKQSSRGANFVPVGNKLAIDASADPSDLEAASDPVVMQMHEGVARRAKEFCDAAKRVGNQMGWSGLGEAATRFSDAVNCETEDIPSKIGLVYDAIISLGSFLDLDSRIRKGGHHQNAIDPLELDVQRVFLDLVRAAAPWVRRFPTARILDDEAGAFLQPALYDPANEIVDLAEASNLISLEDARLLLGLADAANRGDFLGQKAGSRSIWSSKNLVAAVGMILSFEAGMVGNEAASKSVVAANGAKFYLSAEKQVMKLFEDAPPDIVIALQDLINELKHKITQDVPLLPTAPREAKVLRPRSDED